MIHLLQVVWYWFEVHTGTVNEGGPYYGFWSGFGSVFVTPSIFAAMAMYWWHTRCHVKTCLKRGKHDFFDKDNNATYKLCPVHHPGVPAEITHAHILKIHRNR